MNTTHGLRMNLTKKKKKVQLSRYITVEDCFRVFMPVPTSSITICGYNRMALSCHLEHCKKLVSCMCVCVCVLGGLQGAACMCSCFFLSLSFFFFLECDSFTCRLWFFCVPVCVYACVPVCVHGHVFLMKAHAGQINSQKLRGGGSPSL